MKDGDVGSNPTATFMKIQVTQEDIKNADWPSISNCPVARAIRRTTGNFATLGPFRGHIIKGPPPYPCFTLPPEVSDRIMLFDESGEMKPFEFEITL
jgi:hypothetical protein